MPSKNKLLTTKIRETYLNSHIPGKKFHVDSCIFFPKYDQSLADTPADYLLPLSESEQVHMRPDNVPYEQMFNLIQNASCPGGSFSISILETTWHVVPVTLLCTAKAYVLLPDQGNAAQTFHQYFNDLQDLMHSCLFSDLYQRYEASHLSTFVSEQDLLKDYTETIAKWLCSSTHRIDEFSTGGINSTPEHDIVQFDLTFTINDSNHTKAFYQLSTHGYPILLQAEPVHEPDDFVTLRRHLLRQQLEEFFGLIKNQWAQLRALANPNAYILNILDKIITTATLGKERLELPRSTPVEPLKDYEYAFFVTEGGQWQVYFQKENYSRRTTSPGGMFAIKYLLMHPDKHISYEDLHEYLKDAGVKYNVKGHESSSDPSLDDVKRQDNEERFRTYFKLWKEIKNKDNARCTRNDFNTLKYFLGIVDTKIEYSTEIERTRLYNLRQEIVTKIKELLLHLDIDENFTEALKEEKKQASKTGNATNRLETIRKSIYRARNDFKESAPALYQYLVETIIVTKTKASDDSYEPFIHVPSLTKDIDLRYIDWVTSPQKR